MKPRARAAPRGVRAQGVDTGKHSARPLDLGTKTMKEQNTGEYSYEIIEDLETRLAAEREKVRVLRGEVNQLIGNLEAMGLGHSQEAENARQALAATDPDSPGGQ